MSKRGLNNTQKIAFGICIGSLLSMLMIIVVTWTASPPILLSILPITIVSSVIYDKGNELFKCNKVS